MEKLIELLNEYTKQSYDDYSFFRYIEPTHSFYIFDDGYESYIPEEVILGKRFGFISWLVENDKINLDRVPNIFTTRARDRDDVIYAIRVEHNYNILNEQYGVDLVDDVIMYVSIQDEPIKFLISVLKNV